MINCLFLSCHASLEYYMSKIFKEIGVQLPYYDMDVGNPERPFIIGYREPSEKQQLCNKKHHERLWTKDDLADIDFIYMMNFANIAEVARYYTQFDKKIIIHLFGQYNIAMVHDLINLMLDNGKINIVCYSKTEYKIYYVLSYDNRSIRNRLFYIPFGLDSNEFNGWEGTNNTVYTTCNDIHNRAQACGWSEYKQIIVGIPAVLSGRNTEEVGGVGLLPYDKLKFYYQMHRCYLSMGTIPAPYTLTPLEAAMTGCPTVIYDNGMGVADEEIANISFFSSNISEIRNYIVSLINDYEFAKRKSEITRQKAMEIFDIEAVSQSWKEIISQAIS